MANHINTLLRQAIHTFNSNREVFSTNLDKLRILLDKTSPSDIGFIDHELFRNEIWQRIGKAPVTYVDIYEDDTITVGVFVIKAGMKLPLHDHPHMHGLIKVIGGSLQISSYTVTKEYPDANTVEAEKHPPSVLNAADNSVMLEPTRENLHEIESVEGVAAFLDILAPPYDTLIPNNGPRKCSYYNVIEQITDNRLLLKCVESPQWFWTDTYPYTGPKIAGRVYNREESETG